MARSGKTVREGLIVGLIGFAVVAVFYVLFDVLAARGTVFTLDLLGRVVLRGVRDSSILQLPMEPDFAAMLGYNFMHLVVSLAVGLFVAWLVARVEDRPQSGYAVLLILIGGYIATVVIVSLIVRDLRDLLPWWTIVTVNTLAAVGGGLYLWRAHPGLLTRVRGAGYGSSGVCP